MIGVDKVKLVIHPPLILSLNTSLDVALWKMVLEVLTLVMKKPGPRNPFQVDLQYIDSRPPEEGALLSASLLNFLETIWLQADPNLEQELIDQGNFVAGAKRWKWVNIHSQK